MRDVRVSARSSAQRGRGAADAVNTLAGWATAHVSLDDPEAVGFLLRALREAGPADAVTALLARDPAAHVSLDDPGAVAGLLRALGEAGATDAVSALSGRAANAAMFSLFLQVCPGEAARYPSGREPDGTHRRPGHGKNRPARTAVCE